MAGPFNHMLRPVGTIPTQRLDIHPPAGIAVATTTELIGAGR